MWGTAWSEGGEERKRRGRHYISGWDGVPHGSGGSRARRIVYLRSTATAPPDLWLLELQVASPPSKPRRLTSFNAEVLDELELRKPVERHVTVDGRDIQGWLVPAREGPPPLVVPIP